MTRLWFPPLLVVLLALTSCQSSSDKPTAENPADLSAPREVIKEQPLPADALPPDTTLATAFRRFTEAVRQADTAGADAFIAPEYGVWLLEQPGALPKLTRVPSFGRFRRSFRNRSFFTLGPELMPCLFPEPVDSLPTFNCEGTPDNPAGYARQGCLLAKQAAGRWQSVWDYVEPQGGTKAQGRAALARVTHIILQTRTGYSFHWARLNGQWRVLLIDLRTPCSA